MDSGEYGVTYMSLSYVLLILNGNSHIFQQTALIQLNEVSFNHL